MDWNSQSWRKHAEIFKPLIQHLKYFEKFSSWPHCDDYKLFLDEQKDIVTASGKKLKPILNCHEINYEELIYKAGEIETRKNSWHDFFNLLTWVAFPKLKALINELQVREIQAGNSKQRSRLQNALAHFDESGIIVASSDSGIIDKIKKHQWHDLFVAQREHIKKHCKFFLVGHGKYEQCLNPFIGVTAKAIFLEVKSSYFDLDYNEKLAMIDTKVEQCLDEKLSEYKLAPLPILGIPGWWAENEFAEFYGDKQYFRDKI